MESIRNIMRKFLPIVLILSLLLFGLSTKAETEKRTTSPFREVSLRISANLYVEQGDEYSIEVTANPRTLYKLIADIEDEKLIIRFSFQDMWIHNFDPGPVSIKVTTPEINRLSLTGSGNIFAEKKIETDYLELLITGTGDIKIPQLKCNSLETIITGTGDIIVAGNDTLREINAFVAGSGNIKANLLPARYGHFRIGGTGICDVNISEYLDATIIGSGQIRYTGSPEINSSVSGSGRIKQSK